MKYYLIFFVFFVIFILLCYKINNIYFEELIAIKNLYSYNNKELDFFHNSYNTS